MKTQTIFAPFLFGSLMMLSAISPAFGNLTIYQGLALPGSISSYVPIDLSSAPLGAGSPYSFAGGTVSFSGPTQGIVEGTSYGLHDDPTNLDGTPYTGKYFAASSNGSNTITFTNLESSFAFLWGSADPSNVLRFYNGTVLVGTVTGSEITDNRGVGVVIDSDKAFSSVVFSDGVSVFEIAPLVASPNSFTPEPGFYGMMGLGFSVLSFAGLRRSKAFNTKS